MSESTSLSSKLVEISARNSGALVAEQALQKIDVLDDGVDVVAVERQRLLELVEDAYEIEDEPVRLYGLVGFVLVWPVDPRDRLQQRVIPHRLVQEMKPADDADLPTAFMNFADAETAFITVADMRTAGYEKFADRTRVTTCRASRGAARSSSASQ
jgi:hypothetical protein